MMQWMHELSRHWLATLLMGGLALSFMVWGIADVFTGSGTSAVVTVGSTDIDPGSFERSYKNFLRSYSRQSGQEISTEMAQRMGLGNVALQQIIGRTAVDNEAARLGLITPVAIAAQNIQSMPAFRSVAGFDHNSFLRLVGNAGYSEQDFINEVRSDMTRQQLTGAVEGDFLIPPGYAQALLLFLNERRASDYVIASPESVGDIPLPSEAVLAAYVKANPARFSTPEYRDADFAEIGPEDLLNQVTVTDPMIAQEYEAKKSTYVIPEKRDVQQIEFANEAEAKAAKAKIDAGLPFEAVAMAKGVKPAELSLGSLAKTDLSDPARADAVFSLPLNQVSQPVKNAFGGYVLMRASKITPGSSRSLADAKAEIRKALATQLAAGKLVDIVNAFEDARSGGASIAQAAKKTGMKTGHVAAIDANGKAPDGSPAAAPQDPEFLAQLFRAEVGEDSDPFPVKSGHYYAIKINGVTPPKAKSLDQVRAEAILAWTAERRAALLAEKAAVWTAQATKENSLDGVARELKVTVQHSPALTRNTSDTMFSSALVGKLFEARPGGIVSGPQGLSGNFIIARVSGVAHPRIAPNSPGFAAGVQQIAATVAGDFSIAMANAARAKQGVKVNQKLLDAAIGGGT
jgi:peptidyl-prolyl cis-trans isomerase D